MTQKVRVPVAHRAILARVSNLPADEWTALVSAVGGIGKGPTMDHLVDAVNPILGDNDSELLVEAVIAMEGVRNSHGWSQDELIEGVSKAEGVSEDDSTRQALSARLGELLSDPTVSLVAKVAAVATEQPAIFHTCRIITDMRPVFGDDPTSGALGGVLTHTLRVNFGRDGRLESFFVCLDDRDLASLQEAVERALKKQTVLKSWLATAGVQLLEVEGDS